jgi:anti-sigma regulatory factor (Ser/Thr protein kinase)
VIPATDAGLKRAASAFDDFVNDRQVPIEAHRRFLLALDEVLSNIVRHGQPGSTTIGLTFSMDADRLEVEVADSAGPFNPLDAPVPDTTSSLETRKPGGVGIALVRAFMDQVRYERRDDRNVLTLSARVTPPAGD